MSSGNITVPQCAVHVSAGQYSTAAQAKFDLTSYAYYKTYVTSAQVLPGVVVGALCWVVALVFAVWLLTLCCRKVGWRSRRTHVHDTPAPGRNKWAAFNVGLFLVLLGVVATGTWALIEGLKTTDGKVNEFWGLMSQTQAKLQDVSGTIQITSASVRGLQTSLSATYDLINSNQAAATAVGINVPATLSLLQGLEGTVASGQTATQQAQSNLQGQGIVTIENLRSNYKGTTENAWRLYRPIGIAVFFGLLIFFGVIAGVLALIDRTPRSTAAATLLLWLWAGLVLLLGAGVLNLVWRVTRDGCLYGVDYAATKVGGGPNTQVVLDYYFQRTYIPAVDVSQRLFKVNLTAIQQDLSSAAITNAVSQLDSTGGRAFVAALGTPEQRQDVPALGSRLGSLSGNLTALNNQIQASSFAGVTGGVQSLICCSTTNALWDLWLASVITGAVAALLAVLALVKVVTAINPLHRNRHYTPHTPNGTVASPKLATA